MLHPVSFHVAGHVRGLHGLRCSTREPGPHKSANPDERSCLAESEAAASIRYPPQCDTASNGCLGIGPSVKLCGLNPGLCRRSVNEAKKGRVNGEEAAVDDQVVEPGLEWRR